MLTEARRNEIAYLLMRHALSKASVTLNKSVTTQFFECAQEAGISKDEAVDFATLVLRDTFVTSYESVKRKFFGFSR